MPEIDENNNSVLRVLKLFREKTGFTEPVCLTVSKKIPPQAGLGGASSDAAATLFLLQKISGIQLKLDELLEIAVETGADVPLFTVDGPCAVWGKGEKVSEISLSFQRWYVVIKPKEGLSTKEVYHQYDKNPVKYLVNDLEDSAVRLLPKIKEYLQFLRKKEFLIASLTGSGSAVFGMTDEKKKARSVFKEAKDAFSDCEIFLAQGLNSGFKTGLIESR